MGSTDPSWIGLRQAQRCVPADEYIKTFPADKQAILKQVREAIPWPVRHPSRPIRSKEYAKELSGYKQSKSAVNFPLDETVPVKLIGRLAKFQAEDIEARAKDKAKVGVKKKLAKR